jgi:hypothetical protein
MKRSTKKQILSLFILFAFIGSSITYALISAVPVSEQVQSNWAARIDIVINNQLYTIPGGIGMSENSTAKLFTQSSNNIIYKTGSQDASLRDFFEIWGKTFNSTCILEYCNSDSASMRMYVNNAENFDYELYKIKSGDYIQIDYRPIFKIPTPNVTSTPSENYTVNNTNST